MVTTNSLGWMMQRRKGGEEIGAGLKFQMEPIERYQNVFKANVKADAGKGSGGGGGA